MLVSLQKRLAYFYCRRNYNNEPLPNLENNSIFNIIDQIRVSRVPLLIEIAIFVWRVTWSYCYSPFHFNLLSGGSRLFMWSCQAPESSKYCQVYQNSIRKYLILSGMPEWYQKAVNIDRYTRIVSEST